MRRLATRPAALVIGPVCAVALAATSGSGPAAASGSPVSSARTTALVPAGPDHAAGKVGRWKVARRSATGSYKVTWTSPTRLPYSDARPEIVAHGLWAGPSTVSANGRRVSVVVTSDSRPTSADFDVLLAGKTLDHRARSSAIAPTRAPYKRPAIMAAPAEDPGVAGFHGITTTDYKRLDPVKLPDIPQLAEMVEHVVAPKDATTASPLVMFLHGRHEPCYVPGRGAEPPGKPLKAAATVWQCPGKSKPVPSYLGYDYVQRLLASQGYVTVSISANAINALDWNAPDGGAAARAALIRHHLKHWAKLVADGDQAADLDNVILVGHSRGGEGVNRASLTLATAAKYHVTGQILLGPTDFGFQAAPFTPTVTVLPYCDGDVSDLQGQNFTDDARDLTSEQIAFHSSILVMGANHNFFNTEWTPRISAAPSFDDWFGHRNATCGVDDPGRLSAAEQRKVGKAYIAGAVHLFADDDQAVVPMYDGSAVSVPSADNADVRSHAIGGGLDIRRPGLDSSVGSTSAAATLRLCTGVSAAGRQTACEPLSDSVRTPHWPAAYAPGVPLRKDFEMQWTAPDEFAGIDFASGWDVSGSSHLDLRTIVDPALGRVRLDVELLDGVGGRAVVTPEGGGALSPLPGHTFPLPKRWGQTLRVRLGGVTDVDLTDIRSIHLISRTPDGRVWILDMSAAPSSGIPAPSGQFPLISFGSVRQAEGDGQHGTLHIPYHINADLAAPATINVTLLNPFTRRPSEPEPLVISPHQTDGTFNVRYQADTVADFPRRTMQVVAYAVEGIQTDRYIGRATIVDDDPVPAVTARPVDKVVAEGHPARWRIHLSGPLGFPSMVIGRAVRGGDGRQLTVGDLPKNFREHHFFPIPPLDTPLPKAHLLIYQQLPTGHTSSTIELPVRRTRSDDGVRAVTFRFRVYGIPDRKPSTVRVVEPRV